MRRLFIFFLLTLAGSALHADLSYPCSYDQMQSQIAPYLLPHNHPMKSVLDAIFSQSRVLVNERTFTDAGFIPIAGPMPNSFVIVARHPASPGYVFKLYLDSEWRCRKQIPNWVWLTRRCIGAAGIRNMIKRKKMQYFLVPDKWLYVLPVYRGSNPLILIETDMELESPEVTEQMWKNGITYQHLDELYAIFQQGYGGHGIVNLTANVPFTKHGKFAFTDTEDPQDDLNLNYVRQYLSKEMRDYWDMLIDR